MDKFGSDLPRGPNGECRPRDPISLAAAVVRIATGESNEAMETARAITEAKADAEASKRHRQSKGWPQMDR